MTKVVFHRGLCERLPEKKKKEFGLTVVGGGPGCRSMYPFHPLYVSVMISKRKVGKKKKKGDASRRSRTTTTEAARGERP